MDVVLHGVNSATPVLVSTIFLAFAWPAVALIQRTLGPPWFNKEGLLAIIQILFSVVLIMCHLISIHPRLHSFRESFGFIREVFICQSYLEWTWGDFSFSLQATSARAY